MLKIFFVSVIAILSGCSLFAGNHITFNISANKDLNPNIYNQSSPVVITIYQMSSISKIKENGIYHFLNNTEIYETDITFKEDIEVQPKQQINLNQKIQNKTRYLVFIGEFRSQNGRDFAKIIDLSEADISKINIDVVNNKIILKQHYKREW